MQGNIDWKNKLVRCRVQWDADCVYFIMDRAQKSRYGVTNNRIMANHAYRPRIQGRSNSRCSISVPNHRVEQVTGPVDNAPPRMY